MSRRIVCEKCGLKARKPMHREDVDMGFARRVVTGVARKPSVHQIKTYVDGELTATENLATLVCDDCGSVIPNGEKCVAVSMWRGGSGCEMDPWESQFMDVDV